MKNTVSKTVSNETLNAIIQIESGGRLNAKAATSSALGLGQFLNRTWDDVVKKHRPDLLAGRTQDQVRALRTDPQIAVELLARFTEDNQRIIGMNCTGGDLYLAHFLGTGDAKDLFRADPSTPVSELVAPEVIKANPSIMTGKNAGQVRAWAAKRMHESAGRSWVEKYYKPHAAVAALVDEGDAEPEETAEDIPDTQGAPAVAGAPKVETAVVSVDKTNQARTDEIQASVDADTETRTSWLRRKWKGATATVSSFLGLGGVGLFDWRIVAALAIVVFIFSGAIILFMGPGDVRAWVRKQVA